MPSSLSTTNTMWWHSNLWCTRQACKSGSASGDIPPSPSSKGSPGDWWNETGRQMNSSEINAFLHILDHCLTNMDVVHPFLAYIRDNEVCYRGWVTHIHIRGHTCCLGTPWEVCAFIPLFTQHFTALPSQMLPKCQDEEMIFNEVTTPIHLPLFKTSWAFLSLLAD